MQKSNLTKIIVLSGPSGSGKTTISKKLVQAVDHLFFITTHTTREPRKGEIDGIDYHFIKKDEFLALKKQGFFVENAEVFGNYYGVSFAEIDKHLKKNQNILLEIDWQGAEKIREVYAKQCLSIFIQTKDLNELRKRLILRAKDDAKVVEKRVKQAEYEITKAKQYDIHLVNQDLDQTFKIIKSNIDSFLS